MRKVLILCLLAQICAFADLTQGQPGSFPFIKPCDQDCGNGVCAKFFGFIELCKCHEGFNGTSCDNDVLPPTIICPDDVTIPTDRGYNYTYTEFKPSTIEDNDGDSPSVSSIPASGSRFYFGNNPVRMIASDKAGNIGTCEFTITVIALPGFICNNVTRVEGSAVCNTFWDCQNGADELDCDPQIINGSTIEHPLQYNATWLFQGPEELGVHIIFNSSNLNGIALNFGEGHVPGRNDYSTGDHLYEVDVHLPSNLIWITVTSSDNMEGSSSLFVETSTFSSPIHIQEGSTLINVTENINCILKVTVPADKWIEGTFLTDYNYDALLATRSEEGGPLIPLSLSFVPSAFLYPTNAIWILHFRGVLLNISAHDPQVIRLDHDESTELKIESDSDNGCYEQAWVVQLPESSQYAMKVSNNNLSANVVFFEGIYPYAIPLGYFQSSTGGFVTHVTNTTITVVAFADHLCNFGENIRSFINIKVEMKRENLDVALGQDDIFSMSSAQVCYTDNLLANRRIFSSQKELFVESDRIFSSCALLSLGEPLIVNDELFNNQFVFGSVLSHRSRSSIGVLQTPDPNGCGDCPYNIKVHSAVPSGYMVCPGYNTVVKETQVCDSEWDCAGGEDEFDCEPKLVLDHALISDPRSSHYFTSSLRPIKIFTFQKQSSDTYFFLNVTSDISRYSELAISVGIGSYEGMETDPIITVTNDELLETDQLLYFRNDTIWIEIQAEDDFEASLSVGNESEDFLLCSDSFVIFGADRCNGLHQCSSGDDEVGCSPLALNVSASLILPDWRHAEVVTWSFYTTEEAVFIVHFNNDVYYDYSYLAIGKGGDPSDNSSIIVQWSSYQYHNYEFNHLIDSQEIWITLMSDYYLPHESPGFVEAVPVTDITVLEGISEELTQLSLPVWILRFPSELGCKIDCYNVSLHYDSKLQFGVGDDFNVENVIVDTRYYHDSAEIQIPYDTIWITLQTDFSYYGGYYDDYDSFTCSVMAVHTKVNLLQANETDVSFVTDYKTVYWVGWSLIPPDSLGILITFHDGTISDFSIVSIGTDLEDTIADYQFLAGEPLGNIFVNSSAWIVLSMPSCYGTCQQTITVSADDATDFLVCEGFVYRELDVCNNSSSCENGADESGCVTATLDPDETITFPLLSTTSKDENIDMIWSIVMSSDARALVRFGGSLSYHQTLEFGSGVWETGKSIELTMNYRNSTEDLLLPWNSFWIRYKASLNYDYYYDYYYYYYNYGSLVELVVTAVIGDDIMVCDVSYLVINQTMICDGQPFCPYSCDEIGCEQNGDKAILQTTNYPGYINSFTYQRWEYFTAREDVTMVIQFMELRLAYSTCLYAGIGSITPENASVDYPPAADCYLTQYDPIQDLHFESNMIWIAIASDKKYRLRYTRMWAEIRVLDADEEILMCEDGMHIAFSDQLCDNIWACENGEDELGCEAFILGNDDEFQAMSQPRKTSWILSLASPDDQIFAVQIPYYTSPTLRVGSGSNFNDPDTLIRIVVRNNYDGFIYIGGAEMWLTFDGGSTLSKTTTVTVISRSEFFNCSRMNEFVAMDKLCDSAWDCPNGLDESDCEPTYLNETDSHGISSYNSYRDDEGLTNSWAFEVPDGFEAVLTSINVNVRYTIIAFGAGTDPTNSSSHLYSVLDSSSPDLVVPKSKFWIKFIRVRSYGSSSTSVDITLRPLQIGGCQDEEFMCTLTRECISSYQTCDGTTNCLDKSDETSCPCSSISEARCGNGECVKRNEVCSNSHYGNLACTEDPFSCDFKCATWYGDDVIHNTFLCDGYRDCIDGSDEDIENCECKPPAFSCGGRCLSPNRVCDGVVDCLDGLDESDCECSSFELPRDEDECVAYWDCCLERDCIDSDVCGACPADYFQCSDLTCLAGEYVCDNIINCPAGEDEADCGGLVTALPGGGELPTIIPDIYDIELDVVNETILSTDDYVSGISNSLKVTWVINAPLGYGIQLQTFGINFGYDTAITIGGGDSIGRNQIAELERYSNSYHLLRSSTVWIHYTSRYTSIEGVIFKLSAVPNIGISDVIYVDPDEKVVIESPMYPQDYPVKVDKVWNFHTLDGHGFLVKFTNFSLEQNWDYVSLGGGVEPRTASQLAAFSGKSLPDDFSFYHSNMWMRFTSDLSKTCKGFRAEITSVIDSADYSESGSKQDFEAGTENGLPNTGCLVLITENLRLLCGGTLINSRWVLTSSDDIWDKQLNSNLEVHVGVGDFQESLNEDKTYGVTAIFRVINNDGEDSGLVLMKLNETVDAFATEIFSACLPRNDPGIESGAYVNIFGWNTGVPTGGATLSVSREPVVSSEFCRRRRYSDIHGQEDSFCTGYIEGYGADCYNLYGGPVMNADTTSGCPEVIGVVVRQSYRWSCDQTSQPKIFPLVSSHTALMREIMEFN